MAKDKPAKGSKDKGAAAAADADKKRKGSASKEEAPKPEKKSPKKEEQPKPAKKDEKKKPDEPAAAAAALRETFPLSAGPFAGAAAAADSPE